MVRPGSVELGEQRVRIDWSDGHSSVFSNVSLREACPCALCKGEVSPMGGRRSFRVLQDISADVKATAFTRVGLYALSFAWSDGHSTGIYPYDYLLSLCECSVCLANRG